MSWEDQGRQGHGWFGHGSASGAGANTPPDSGADALFNPTNTADRFDAIAHAAIANLPTTDRNRASASFDAGRLGQFRSLMSTLNDRNFPGASSDLSANSKAVDLLRQAAGLADKATSQRDLAQASSLVAQAMQTVGLDSWSRFLAGAASNADARGPSSKKIQLAELQTPNRATDASPASPAGYVDPDPKQWINDKGSKPVGSGECVALVQAANGANAPHQAAEVWRRGDQVQGNAGLKPGTAIATFIKGADGQYHYSGHAAIYLGQDEHGMHVIDQWNVRDAKTAEIISQHAPSERIIPFHDPDPNRAMVDKGENYYAIK
jgi:hypothetical protein